MKTAMKRILSIGLCICMLMGMIVVGDGSGDRTYADTAAPKVTAGNQAFIGSYPTENLKTSNDPYDIGTVENPFVVLEVVPTLEQAQFGYFIPGCEPIDMDAAAADGKNIKLNNKTLESFLNLTDNFDIETVNKHVDEWEVPRVYEDIPKNTTSKIYRGAYPERTEASFNYVANQEAENCWYQEAGDPESLEKGCFEFVGEGNGCFNIGTAGTAATDVSDVQDADGNFYGFTYVGAGNGNYQWNTDSSVPADSNDPSVGIWATRTKFKCHAVEDRCIHQITNKDRFIKEIFNRVSSSGSFITKVLTITPELLGQDNNLHLINEADLIFFHTDNTNKELRKLWYAYNKDEKLNDSSKIDGGVDTIDFTSHDITNQTAINIMDRMTGDNAPALIFEGSFTRCGEDAGTGLSYNLAKLNLMVTMFEPSKFKELGLLQAVIDASSGKDKLCYPAKKYDNATMTVVDDPIAGEKWTYATNLDNDPKSRTGTFIYDDNGNDISADIRYDGKQFYGTNVFDKIYVYNGNTSMFQGFFATHADITYNEYNNPRDGGIGMSDLVDFYKPSGKTEYTPIDIMKFILSVPQYKPILNVLEIQPCQQFIYGNETYKMTDENGNVLKDSKGNTLGWVDYYEGLFPWYNRAQDGGKSWVTDSTRLKVTKMTTAEFIGSTGRYEYGKLDEKTGDPITLTTDSSDDLIAKYDLIIIGSMQDASNGKNGYNDPNLKNLVYTSVGDLVYKYGTNMSDQANTKNYKRDRMRYSGTDITLKKMLELEDFLKAGRPIVVDLGLYKKDGNSYTVDTSKVDLNSKLYDFLTWKDKDEQRSAQKNILRYKSYESDTMKNLIGGSKCKIVFFNDQDSYPLEYSYSEDNTQSIAKGIITYENYQAKNVNGKAVLNYHFYIEGSSEREYRLRLALDSDGDGVYRGSLKEHSEIRNMKEVLGQTFDETKDYDSLELPIQMTVEQVVNGQRVELKPEKEEEECYLKANTEYYASYELPDDRLGIVPWKLEVNAVDNEYLRSSAIDFTAFEKTGDPAQLNVLQMRLSHGGRNSWTDNNEGKATYFTRNSVWIRNQKCYDPTYEYSSRDNDNPNNKLWNLMQNHQKETVKKFETYLEPVKEFDVHIQYLFNADWNQLFGTAARDKDGKEISEEDRIEDWEDFLSQYDMVVLGFWDENCFTENTVFATGINSFISQGKSMILSHDTVEGANADSKYYNKYAPWVRSFAGQRRAYYNKQTDGTYAKSYLTTYANGKVIDKDLKKANGDVDYYKKDANTINNVAAGNDSGYIHPDLRKNTTPWGHIFTKETDFLDPENPDLNAGPVEEKFLGTFTKENIDNAAQLYANHYRYDYHEKTEVDRVELKDSHSSGAWPNDNACTSVVKLANNGQITSYPYKINSFIMVCNTHCQNYQLDMDYEDGGDVNVWFNLTDSYDEELQELNKAKKTSTDVQNELQNKSLSNLKTGIYSAKNQDSRNNFYIYNKGNISYTGCGHGMPSKTFTDDEVKLFVNTMISAYRPPEATPYVSIDNATSVASNGDSLLYVDYDTDNEGKNVVDSNIVDMGGLKMVKVEFSIKDSGSHKGITDQKYYLNIFKGDNKDAEKSDQLNFKDAMDKVSGSDSTFIVEPGKKYVMYIPYSDVSSSGSVTYRYSTYMTYKKEKRKSRTPTSNTTLTTMILPLFDLN